MLRAELGWCSATQRGQDWCCWLMSPPPSPLPSPLGAGSPGHPPAQNLMPSAAAGDGWPVLGGFVAVGHRGAPCRGSVGGCSWQAKGAAGWEGGRGGVGEEPQFSPFGGEGGIPFAGGLRCAVTGDFGERWVPKYLCGSGQESLKLSLETVLMDPHGFVADLRPGSSS